MIRAIIDTNILISALIIKRKSPPAEIYEAFKSRIFTLVSSAVILAEVEDVINRENIVKLHTLSKNERRAILEEIVHLGLITPGKREVTAASDPDDNMFLSAAKEGKATYIVTGDKGHLLSMKEYDGIQIITARKFVEILNEKK
jgi:putative PIN family toxin of toxin-antitoxin system